MIPYYIHFTPYIHNTTTTLSDALDFELQVPPSSGWHEMVGLEMFQHILMELLIIPITFMMEHYHMMVEHFL